MKDSFNRYIQKEAILLDNAAGLDAVHAGHQGIHEDEVDLLLKFVYGSGNLLKRKVDQNRPIYDNGEENCAHKLFFFVDLKPDT